ncbi:MAG: hypothetical protein Q9227_001339 [Pyrenula ochraceoflavens]
MENKESEKIIISLEAAVHARERQGNKGNKREQEELHVNRPALTNKPDQVAKKQEASQRRQTIRSFYQQMPHFKVHAKHPFAASYRIGARQQEVSVDNHQEDAWRFPRVQNAMHNERGRNKNKYEARDKGHVTFVEEKQTKHMGRQEVAVEVADTTTGAEAPVTMVAKARFPMPGALKKRAIVNFEGSSYEEAQQEEKNVVAAPSASYVPEDIVISIADEGEGELEKGKNQEKYPTRQQATRDRHPDNSSSESDFDRERIDHSNTSLVFPSQCPSLADITPPLPARSQKYYDGPTFGWQRLDGARTNQCQKVGAVELDTKQFHNENEEIRGMSGATWRRRHKRKSSKETMAVALEKGKWRRSSVSEILSLYHHISSEGETLRDASLTQSTDWEGYTVRAGPEREHHGLAASGKFSSDFSSKNQADVGEPSLLTERVKADMGRVLEPHKVRSQSRNLPDHLGLRIMSPLSLIMHNNDAVAFIARPAASSIGLSSCGSTMSQQEGYDDFMKGLQRLRSEEKNRDAKVEHRIKHSPNAGRTSPAGQELLTGTQGSREEGCGWGQYLEQWEIQGLENQEQEEIIPFDSKDPRGARYIARDAGNAISESRSDNAQNFSHGVFENPVEVYRYPSLEQRGVQELGRDMTMDSIFSSGSAGRGSNGRRSGFEDFNPVETSNSQENRCERADDVATLCRLKGKRVRDAVKGVTMVNDVNFKTRRQARLRNTNSPMDPSTPTSSASPNMSNCSTSPAASHVVLDHYGVLSTPPCLFHDCTTASIPITPGPSTHLLPDPQRDQTLGLDAWVRENRRRNALSLSDEVHTPKKTRGKDSKRSCLPTVGEAKKHYSARKRLQKQIPTFCP